MTKWGNNESKQPAMPKHSSTVASPTTAERMKKVDNGKDQQHAPTPPPKRGGY